MQASAATVETVWNFLSKPKMVLPFDLAIPLLGLYPKNPETPIQKNLCTPMFIAEEFTIAKCWKQPECTSVIEWIKKLWYIYKMEYYPAERKKELPILCDSMDGTGEHYAKQNTPGSMGNCSTSGKCGPAPTWKSQWGARFSRQDPCPQIVSPVGNQACIVPRPL